MVVPTHAELAALLSGTAVAEEHGTVVLQIITTMAKAYTRGRGFADDGTPVEEIRDVILTAAARLVSNSRGLQYSEAVGPESYDYRSAFTGWTVVERICLDRWRIRAL